MGNCGLPLAWAAGQYESSLDPNKKGNFINMLRCILLVVAILVILVKGFPREENELMKTSRFQNNQVLTRDTTSNKVKQTKKQKGKRKHKTGKQQNGGKKRKSKRGKKKNEEEKKKKKKKKK